MVALLASSQAAAHPRDVWYWNRSKAEYKLDTVSRVPGLFGGDGVSGADCVGIGVFMRAHDSSRERLYKHFNCDINVDFPGYQVKTFNRILHVLGPNAFVLSTP